MLYINMLINDIGIYEVFFMKYFKLSVLLVINQIFIGFLNRLLYVKFILFYVYKINSFLIFYIFIKILKYYVQINDLILFNIKWLMFIYKWN